MRQAPTGDFPLARALRLRFDARERRHGLIAMELTGLEREFLKRLVHGPWASPSLFDHGLVARLVDDGLVQTESLPGGSVQYEITDAGRAKIEQA